MAMEKGGKNIMAIKGDYTANNLASNMAGAKLAGRK